jgi:hypothetical protein
MYVCLMHLYVCMFVRIYVCAWVHQLFTHLHQRTEIHATSDQVCVSHAPRVCAYLSYLCTYVSTPIISMYACLCLFMHVPKYANYLPTSINIQRNSCYCGLQNKWNISTVFKKRLLVLVYYSTPSERCFIYFARRSTSDDVCVRMCEDMHTHLYTCVHGTHQEFSCCFLVRFETWMNKRTHPHPNLCIHTHLYTCIHGTHEESSCCF